MNPTKVEVSHRTIVFTFLFALTIWFLYQVRQILLLLFISLIFTFVLEPLVEGLEKLKIPRWLAILSIYLLLFFFAGVSLAGMIPPLIDQTTALISGVPEFFKQIGFPKIDQNLINNQITQLGSIPVNIFKLILSFFSNIATLLLVAVFTFYFLEERKKMDEYLTKYFSKKDQERVKRTVRVIEKRLGGWVRGEIVLMMAVGLLSYLGYRLLGIDYALPLAILAGLLEIVPNIGPILATVPAVLAGLSISAIHGLAALAWSFLVQQTENNFIVPKVMQKAVGVGPLITLVSLSVGFRLAGVAGAVLAIPIVLTLEVVISELASQKAENS